MAARAVGERQLRGKGALTFVTHTEGSLCALQKMRLPRSGLCCAKLSVHAMGSVLVMATQPMFCAWQSGEQKEVPAGAAATGGGEPENVLEAREWIRAWRARCAKKCGSPLKCNCRDATGCMHGNALEICDARACQGTCRHEAEALG